MKFDDSSAGIVSWPLHTQLRRESNRFGVRLKMKRPNSDEDYGLCATNIVSLTWQYQTHNIKIFVFFVRFGDARTYIMLCCQKKMWCDWCMTQLNAWIHISSHRIVQQHSTMDITSFFIRHILFIFLCLIVVVVFLSLESGCYHSAGSIGMSGFYDPRPASAICTLFF